MTRQIDLSSLTRRQREVLSLVLQGDSNKEISRKIFVTERTAETHVTAILAKVGLDSRTRLIARLLHQKIQQLEEATSTKATP